MCIVITFYPEVYVSPSFIKRYLVCTTLRNVDEVNTPGLNVYVVILKLNVGIIVVFVVKKPAELCCTINREVSAVQKL